MYTTLEEVAGQAGIKLFFSDTGKKTYWWVWENASWRVVFDPAEKGSVKKDRVAPKEPKVDETNGSRDVSRSGRSLARNDSIGEASERNLKPDSSGSNIKNHFRRSASDSKKSKNPSLITSGVVKVYLIFLPLFICRNLITSILSFMLLISLSLWHPPSLAPGKCGL